MSKKKNKNSVTAEQKINRIYTQALTCEREKFYLNLKNLANEILCTTDTESFNLFLHLTDNYKGRLNGEELAEMAEIISKSGGLAQKAAMLAGPDTAKRLLETADQMAGGAAIKNPELADRSSEIKAQCSDLMKNVGKLNFYSCFNEISKMVQAQTSQLGQNAQKRHR